MKLIDMNIKEYMDILKTDAPAPGGGSVAGVTGAQGISLTLMVLDLTLGREKYKEFENDNQEANRKALVLYDKLLNAADQDREAFLKLSEAYKFPKDTEEEKAERKEVIGKYSIGATEAPFEVMKLAYEGLKITEALVGKSNRMASSDLGVAAANLLAASKSAWLNVKINLPYIIEADLKEKFEKDGTELLVKTEKLAERIYDAVEGDL